MSPGGLAQATRWWRGADFGGGIGAGMAVCGGSGGMVLVVVA
jgi:hypothetical protein